MRRSRRAPQRLLPVLLLPAAVPQRLVQQPLLRLGAEAGMVIRALAVVPVRVQGLAGLLVLAVRLAFRVPGPLPDPRALLVPRPPLDPRSLLVPVAPRCRAALRCPAPRRLVPRLPPRRLAPGVALAAALPAMVRPAVRSAVHPAVRLAVQPAVRPAVLRGARLPTQAEVHLPYLPAPAHLREVAMLLWPAGSLPAAWRRCEHRARVAAQLVAAP